MQRRKLRGGLGGIYMSSQLAGGGCHFATDLATATACVVPTPIGSTVSLLHSATPFASNVLLSPAITDAILALEPAFKRDSVVMLARPPLSSPPPPRSPPPPATSHPTTPLYPPSFPSTLHPLS